MNETKPIPVIESPTKTGAVLRAFADGRWLDVFSAQRAPLFDSCLSQSVQFLEAHGWKFDRYWVEAKRRDGGTYRFKKYRLSPESLELARERFGLAPAGGAA